MSNTFWKGFHLCFSPSLLKCSSPPSLPSNRHQDDPRRPSILINTFNFLHDDHLSSPKRLTAAHSSSTTTTTTTTTSSSSTSSYYSDSDVISDSPPPDFAAVYASHRFFFSSPGPSNSIIESPDSRSQDLTDGYKQTICDEINNYSTAGTATSATSSRLVNGGVAVKQHVYSLDPYADFRRSMQEMIEAMDVREVRGDFGFLHELLLCYLSLNPKRTHKFIVRAFADTVVSLLSQSRRKIDG